MNNQSINFTAEIGSSTTLNKLDFTVAIPAYNAEHRLPLMLEKLQAQTNISSLNWEILIVDNNSTDNTAKVIQEYINNWDKPYQLKYCFEIEQGAAYARLKAVNVAKGELICFLDDDNLPNADWLFQAYLFAKKHPQAGAFSGQIHGDFEVQPPPGFDKIKAFLAIREHGEAPFIFAANNLRLPPGAGMVVRKQAWDENVPQRPLLSGKLPGLMVQGDDYEPLLFIHKAGWEIWYNPLMHSYHQIPHWRLEKNYLLTLSRGCGIPTCQLLMINAQTWQKPVIIMRTLLGNLRRIIIHFIKYRQQLETNAIAACEMEFFIGSMLSVFYYLKKELKSRIQNSEFLKQKV